MSALPARKPSISLDGLIHQHDKPHLRDDQVARDVLSDSRIGLAKRGLPILLPVVTDQVRRLRRAEVRFVEREVGSNLRTFKPGDGTKLWKDPRKQWNEDQLLKLCGQQILIRPGMPKKDAEYVTRPELKESIAFLKERISFDMETVDMRTQWLQTLDLAKCNSIHDLKKKRRR